MHLSYFIIKKVKLFFMLSKFLKTTFYRFRVYGSVLPSGLATIVLIAV